jgi:hypothetical protein
MGRIIEMPTTGYIERFGEILEKDDSSVIKEIFK